MANVFCAVERDVPETLAGIEQEDSNRKEDEQAKHRLPANGQAGFIERHFHATACPGQQN